MSSVYLARQPIVSLEENLYAYEVMYVDSNKQSYDSTDRCASASVINSILNQFGTKEFVGEHKAFIKIDEKFLMSDLIMNIPLGFFVFSLLEEIEMSEKVIERVEQLHYKGFLLGINDIDLNYDAILKYKKIMDNLSYIKINIYSDMGVEEKDMVVALQDEGLKVIAANIKDLNLYQVSKDLGFDLYQGHWFAKPNILENQKFDPEQFNVLTLYNMLMKDTDIDEIAKEFERNHALSLHLLRFINSGAFHFKQKISSIHQILTLVGRRSLAQWLMLMIYSKSVSKSDTVSPLMLMVKNRTELMQNLLKTLKPDVKNNALAEAYFVGVLSLMDVVFGVHIEEILENMNISDIAIEALLYDKGTLGVLYKAVRDIEDFNIQEIAQFTNKYKLQSKDLQGVILKSIKEVNSFEKSLINSG